MLGRPSSEEKSLRLLLICWPVLSRTLRERELFPIQDRRQALRAATFANFNLLFPKQMPFLSGQKSGNGGPPQPWKSYSRKLTGQRYGLAKFWSPVAGLLFPSSKPRNFKMRHYPRLPVLDDRSGKMLMAARSKETRRETGSSYVLRHLLRLTPRHAPFRPNIKTYPTAPIRP